MNLINTKKNDKNIKTIEDNYSLKTLTSTIAFIFVGIIAWYINRKETGNSCQNSSELLCNFNIILLFIISSISIYQFINWLKLKKVLFLDDGDELTKSSYITFTIVILCLWQFYIYFLVDGEGVEEEVEITKIRCAFYYAKTNSYASFPFDLRLKFKKDLDYTHAKYPTILIQYKLPNGDKGYYEHEQFSARSSKNPLVTLEGNKIYRLVDMERLYNEEYPYFKPIELMWDELTKDSSSNNGEIKLVFPTRSGSNILVSFNPFHESWLELYLDKCRDTDEAAKKLEYVMGSFLTEETSKAMDFDEF